MHTEFRSTAMKPRPLALAIAALLGTAGAFADDGIEGISTGIVITSASAQTSESGLTGSVDFRLSGRPLGNNTVQVVVTSSDTTEGQVQNGTVQFNTSNWNVAQQVIVVGQDDSDFDGNVDYTVSLNASSQDFSFNGRSAQQIFTNLDNERASFVISAQPALQTTESGGTAGFSVSLSNQPITNVNVVIVSLDSTEGVVGSAPSLRFDSSNWNVAQSVTVVGQDDSLLDGDISYLVELRGRSAQPAFDNLYTNVVLVNLDDEITPAFVITQQPNLQTTESGATASFTVALAAQPNNPLNVAVFSSDTSEGRVQSGGLGFGANNWNIAQTVVVSGQDDRFVDGDIGYAIELISGSGEPAFNNLRANVSLVNVDDDIAGFVITQAANLQTSEAGTNAIFSVALSAQPQIPLNVAVFSSDTSEGLVQSAGAIGFTSRNWNVAQQIVVVGQDDALVDGDIAYVVELVSFSGESAFNDLRTNVSLVNLDNDAGNGDPMLTTLPINRTQGSARYRSTIGSVTNAAGVGAVSITVNGGSSANINGVEVQVLRNTDGTVSALVRASCTATNASFTITANNGSNSNSRQLDVFVATGGNPLWCQWWPR